MMPPAPMGERAIGAESNAAALRIAPTTIGTSVRASASVWNALRMDKRSAPVSHSDLQAVWAALLAAEDYKQGPSGFEPEDDPAQKVSRAKSIVEAAMGAAGGDGFYEV